MNNICEYICKDCTVCAIAKKRKRVHNSLSPIICEKFNAHVTIDFKGPFRANFRDDRYALVCVDNYSGYVSHMPTQNTTTSDTIDAYLQGWISKFGVPDVTHSDSGNGLKSIEFTNMLVNLGGKHYKGSPHHSESQGKVERMIEEINRALKIF